MSLCLYENVHTKQPAPFMLAGNKLNRERSSMTSKLTLEYYRLSKKIPVDCATEQLFHDTSWNG